jgi:hypothetical protein
MLTVAGMRRFGSAGLIAIATMLMGVPPAAAQFKLHKPEDVIKSVMTKLERKGKGIILMHDFHQATARAMPDLLNELKAKGYKIVHMRAKTPVATLAQWDAAAKSEVKGAAAGTVPATSVVRAVEDSSVPVAARPAKGPHTK